MAKRPRSHQLEDESITAFRAARPSLWPVRKKDDDYGIDLEVEIFDEQETSTGVIFFVQLKATDDEQDRKIVLDREYLDGICQYDTPTIIVRYFARDRSLYWAWARDLRAQIPEEQSSKTFHFDDNQILDQSAFAEISKALFVSRYLANLPPTSPLRISLKFDGVQGRRKLDLRRSLEQIEAAETPAITYVESDGSEVAGGVVLQVGAETVRISFGPRYTCMLIIDENMPASDVAGRALYAISCLLAYSGMSAHAARHSKNLLELNIKTDVRQQAAEAARCLANEPEAYVNLAILNDLHALQDVHYLSVLFGIYETSGSQKVVSKQGIRFLEAALSRAARDGPQSEGVILYSMANAARRVDTRFAYSIYMRAKRKKPDYKNISYYLREVAGCLFILGRYRKSRELYEASGMDPSSTLDCLLLGDACLFSGDFDRANQLFAIVRDSEDALIQAEGHLKHWLVGRLAQTDMTAYGVSALTDKFNTGVSLARAGNHEAALVKFLPCCLLAPADHESWINAAICCHNMGDMQLYVHTLTVGFSLEGEALLDSMMNEFESRNVDDKMYDFLAEAYAAVRSLKSNSDQMTRRKFDHHFDVTIPIDGSVD